MAVHLSKMAATMIGTRITMSLKIEDHKTASESMRSKRVCQGRDVNISLINVIDSACRC